MSHNWGLTIPLQHGQSQLKTNTWNMIFLNKLTVKSSSQKCILYGVHIDTSLTLKELAITAL
jgi:hypothetical protein